MIASCSGAGAPLPFWLMYPNPQASGRIFFSSPNLGPILGVYFIAKLDMIFGPMIWGIGEPSHSFYTRN